MAPLAGTLGSAKAEHECKLPPNPLSPSARISAAPHNKQELLDILSTSSDVKERPAEQKATILEHQLDVAFDVNFRSLLKLVCRMLNAEGLNSTMHSQVIELHAQILLVTMGSIECSIRFSSAACTWIFSFTTPKATIKNEHTARADDDEALHTLETKISLLPESQRRPPCQAAMALEHREPTLLIGPASFKSHSVRLLARMLNFKFFACNALEAVIVNQTSICEFLLSCMEPRTAGSHAKYSDRTIRPLAFSIGLDASPSTDMEAALVIPETLKTSVTSGCLQWRAKLQVFAPRCQRRRELRERGRTR